jgi:hypothetical protein
MLDSHNIFLGVQCLVKSRGIRKVRASFPRCLFCVPLTVVTPPAQHRHLTGLNTLRVLNSASLNWGHFVAERDGRPNFKRMQWMKFHVVRTQTRHAMYV